MFSKLCSLDLGLSLPFSVFYSPFPILCYQKGSSETSDVSITWELVTHAGSQVPSSLTCWVSMCILIKSLHDSYVQPRLRSTAVGLYVTLSIFCAITKYHRQGNLYRMDICFFRDWEFQELGTGICSTSGEDLLAGQRASPGGTEHVC